MSRINNQHTELNGRSVVARLAAAMAKAVAMAYDATNPTTEHDHPYGAKKLCNVEKCAKSRGLLPMSEFRKMASGRTTALCSKCRERLNRANLRSRGKKVPSIRAQCRYCKRTWTKTSKPEDKASKACRKCRLPASDFYDGVGSGVLMGEMVESERKHRASSWPSAGVMRGDCCVEVTGLDKQRFRSSPYSVLIGER